MQGEDDRYHGPTPIRVDPTEKGFTEDKRVARIKSEESCPRCESVHLHKAENLWNCKECGHRFADRGGLEYRSFCEPLAWYEHRSVITLKDRRAGEKLYRLWYYGCLRSPHAIMRYGEVRGGSDADAVMLLGTEYLAAMQAIRSAQHRELAYQVCCVGEYAGRGRILMLRELLKDLADHFKKTASKQNRIRPVHQEPAYNHD
jgi:hypothetical protein